MRAGNSILSGNFRFGYGPYLRFALVQWITLFLWSSHRIPFVRGKHTRSKGESCDHFVHDTHKFHLRVHWHHMKHVPVSEFRNVLSGGRARDYYTVISTTSTNGAVAHYIFLVSLVPLHSLPLNPAGRFLSRIHPRLIRTHPPPPFSDEDAALSAPLPHHHRPLLSTGTIEPIEVRTVQQATRSEIVDRATRPRNAARQPSTLPQPVCTLPSNSCSTGSSSQSCSGICQTSYFSTTPLCCNAFERVLRFG